jgi:hypothetical protein
MVVRERRAGGSGEEGTSDVRQQRRKNAVTPLTPHLLSGAHNSRTANHALTSHENASGLNMMSSRPDSLRVRMAARPIFASLRLYMVTVYSGR